MEACDDGNEVDEDDCSNACTLPICGDGIVQPGEECDDPNPLLCEDCVKIRPDLTTTSATTGTGDDTTTTTISSTTGDLPTTTSDIPDGTSTTDPSTTSSTSDTVGTSSEDGCGCTHSSMPPLAPLLILLVSRRRRR